jgi:hypothetical protein
MRIFLGSLGIILVLAVAIDVVWTTLRLGSGGRLTSWVTNTLWRWSVRATRSHKILSLLGFFTVLFTVGLWLLLVWTGWTLVFEMSPTAVVESATRQPADLPSRIYFTGSTIITMSTTELRPGSDSWRIVSTLTAANGFFLASLIITYLLPVVTAEIERRRLAVYITALGRTPQEILVRAWNGSDFGKLEDHFVTLTLPMMEVAQGHLAYPVLHCLHSRHRESAIAPSLAVLDEAITLLASVSPERRPDKAALYPLRQAIAEFLSTLRQAHLEPESEPPPPPSLAPLRDAGIPLGVGDQELGTVLDTLTDRRRLLFGLVQREGWSWEDVTRSTTDLKERFES